MKKVENPFRILFDRAVDYFTESIMRRVLFFSLVLVFLIATFLQFVDSWIAMQALYLACAFTAFATMVDSMKKQREFNNQILDMKAEYILRAAERHGPDADLDNAFSDAETLYLQKKKRELTFMVLVKFTFVIVFIVLFAGMV